MKKFLKAWKRIVSLPEGRKAVAKYFGGTAMLCTGLWFLLKGTTEVDAVSTSCLLEDITTPEELHDLANRLRDYSEKRDLE